MGADGLVRDSHHVRTDVLNNTQMRNSSNLVTDKPVPDSNGLNRRKKTILHVITKLELGGAQKVTLMTLERLSDDRYTLGLVTGPGGLLLDRARSVPGLNLFVVPTLNRKIRPVWDARALLALYRTFRKERPDIVHTHSSKAGILGRWAAWLAGVPVIFHTAHGFGFNDYQPLLIRTLYVWLERITGKITTQLVVVSEANAKKAELHRLTEQGRWILCRDAISLKEFLAPGPRREQLSAWEIPDHKIIVGMVACFKPQKAPTDFIEVAATVLADRKDIHFVMVGDGELHENVKCRIQELDLQNHVTLLGWQKNMPEVYRNLDIVVLTSLWEGLPCVFSEAMASGLPIVATDVDGAQEAIEDGQSGFLHEPHATDAIAESVLRLASDEQLRLTMGRKGKARIPEFDIDTSVRRLESAYRACFASQ